MAVGPCGFGDHLVSRGTHPFFHCKTWTPGDEQEKKKMPICTKCGADIDHLHAFVAETNKYEIRLEDTPLTGLSWGRAEPTEGSASLTEFCCPECGETIFKEDKSPPCPICGARDSKLVDDLAKEHIETIVERFLKT